MIDFCIRTYKCVRCGAKVIGDCPAQCSSIVDWSDGRRCGASDFEQVKDLAEAGQAHVLEQSDFDALRTRLRSEPPAKILVGEIDRLETDEEKAARIEDEVSKLANLSAVSRQQIRAELLSLPKILRRVKVERTETVEEVRIRTTDMLDRLEPATKEEIATMRECLEDADVA